VRDPVPREPVGRPLAILAVGAIGVVFGDIGTSPLYALHDAFVGPHGVTPTRDNVLGVLSLFVWALVVVVSVKYLAVMMRADNRGEGGIFALLALTGATARVSAAEREASPRRAQRAAIVLALGIAGAALLYGDGVITPAVSVLSAVEGLAVATPVLESYVVPVTVIVLIAVFAVQPYGTARIGQVFGPVIALWFAVIATIGVSGIVRTPVVLKAIDPRRAFEFFTTHGWHGFPVLGAVVLCVTGGEALYADMGHFGRRPIRLAWFAVAFPSLVLSYLGQGGVLLADPAALANPFFRSAPAWSLYPLVALATAATVIASQAMITAVFSLTSQAVQLGLSPRLRIVHTSSRERGQIYMPGLNWTLMLACLALVIGFRSSTRLASAYGLAVSGTMAITTLLFVAAARRRWKWGRTRVAAIAGAFLVMDLTFLGANLLKIRDGGWIPLAIGAAVFTLLSTWRRGRMLLDGVAAGPGQATDVVDELLVSIRHGSAAHVSGTAVYVHHLADGVPATFLHNLKHNKVVHERVVFMTVVTGDVPVIAAENRVSITFLAEGFWRVVAHCGFMDEANIPSLLALAAAQGLPFRAAETTYFLGRATIVSAPKPGIARWRARLFAVMMRNANPATAHFGLPPNRVVELGAQVEI
jgi:KUP system potassium uptake protein